MFQQHDPAKDFDSLRADVERLRSDLGDLSGSVQHTARRRVRKVRADAHNQWNSARDRADHMRSRGAQLWGDAEHALAERPISSTAIAFGLGFATAALVGSLLRAQRRRQRGRAHRVSQDDLDRL